MATHIVLALLDHVEHAEKVVYTLRQAGFPGEDISIVMRDWSGEREPGAPGASPMAKGAIAGAVAGATPGLLATLAIFLVPGLGWVRAVGPLIALLGAGPGALAGAGVGEIGAAELPEEQSRFYQERLAHGHVLLAVYTRPEDVPRAESLLRQNGAQEIFCTV